MNLLFDITGEDISKLNDEELRTLVGLLCEADYKRGGLPVSGITWGGNQDASDGGIDVRIKSGSLPPVSFITNINTGFQVKKPDMPPSAIKREMKPDGKLRESIRTLIKNQGAYIIASGYSVSGSALEKRIQAMKDAVNDQFGGQDFYVDYYDCSKLASWVREHPTMVLWLRNKTGRQLKGWQPYGNWSGNSGTKADEYIPDEGVRLRHPTDSQKNEMNSTEGLLKIKSLLSVPGVSLRLAGLSGVGKTRFVQALFEDGILENPLNPNLAIYADMSDAPVPDPKAMAEQLIANASEAILIIDNCPPDLHRRLTKTCVAPESKVSVLTVEYDVKDDLPEETDVFVLEPSSDEVIEKLIQRRYPAIGPTDSRTIAEFAGGNARVAIALANTVEAGETLSGFRDEELFLRLFKQRNQDDNSLLAAAEVCSLVYSFEGANTKDENSELRFLGGLISQSPLKLFQHVNILKKRSLIQSRNVWRAVLPHAIANRLAKQALETIPADHILDYFEENATDRLLISFSRRLGYLHDSTSAIEIARNWLRPEGILAKGQGQLNTFQINLLKNIAPVVPLEILEYMERLSDGKEGGGFTSRGNPNFNVFVRLLVQFAYDSKLFYRSTKLICRFALNERIDENNNSIRRKLGVLFQLYLSGTHATVAERSKIIEEFIKSANQSEQELGLFLLGKALKTGSFTGHESTFGARSRDYGFRPKNGQDVLQWYKHFIELCTSLTTTNGNIAKEARILLSNNFRGLWRIGLFDSLEEAAMHIQKSSPWNEGWIAIKTIFQYDRKRCSKEVLSRLSVLEKLLRPTSLIERARTIALTNRYPIIEFEGATQEKTDSSKNWERLQEQAKEIGSTVAQETETLNILLPELLSQQNDRTRSFGEGLGNGSSDLSNSWNMLCTGLENVPENKRAYLVMIGFLNSCSRKNPKFYNETLDSLVEQKPFANVFPYFQANLGIDNRGIQRLRKSLKLGIADIKDYKTISYGRFDKSVKEIEWIKFFNELLSKKDGILVVIESLYFRIKPLRDSFVTLSKRLIKFAGKVLATYDFTGTQYENLDHILAFLVKESFKDNESAAIQMCLHLKSVIMDYIFRHDYQELLCSLATIQPKAFLNIFVDDSDINDPTGLSYWVGQDQSPFDLISDENIVEWCELKPETRIPSIFVKFQPFSRSVETNTLTWRPIVFKLLRMASDVNSALGNLRVSIEPMQWSGSLTDVLQERITLLNEFAENENLQIRSWTKSTQAEFENQIKEAAERENEKQRWRNETFE